MTALPAGVEGHAIRGIHTRRMSPPQLAVQDIRDCEGFILASARKGPRGWYVAVGSSPTSVLEIYVSSMLAAVLCLRGVREAMKQ